MDEVNDQEIRDDLESRLKAHSAYFTSMVELIPAKYYVIKDELSEEGGEMEKDSKFWINKKRSRGPKQAIKEATKKAKRLKFDPLSQQNNQRNQEEDVDKNGVGEALNSSKDTLEERGGIEDLSSDGEEEENISKRHPKAAVNGFSVERVRSGDLNDLRERLHNRIAELRGKRKLMPDVGVGEGEEGEGLSKGLSEKRKKVMERRQQKKESRKKGRERKHSAKQQSREKCGAESNPKRPSIKDESGRIVFSKFDFGTPAVHSEPKPKSKDYRKLLAKAEAAQKKLEKLKEVDEKKSEEIQEKLQWQRAMEMAKGTKVKDDTKRLKKTVKRLDSKKAKSQKQWLEREKQETLAKEKRQEKRKKNIQERIDQARAKKLKKRGGKKRRPGF